MELTLDILLVDNLGDTVVLKLRTLGPCTFPKTKEISSALAATGGVCGGNPNLAGKMNEFLGDSTSFGSEN